MRAAFDLRGQASPTIYAVGQRHISAVEERLEEKIWKTRENNENRIAYSINGSSGDIRENDKCSKSNSESMKPEQRENDGLCRTLVRRMCISESLIPTAKFETSMSQGL